MPLLALYLVSLVNNFSVMGGEQTRSSTLCVLLYNCDFTRTHRLNEKKKKKIDHVQIKRK